MRFFYIGFLNLRGLLPSYLRYWIEVSMKMPSGPTKQGTVTAMQQIQEGSLLNEQKNLHTHIYRYETFEKQERLIIIGLAAFLVGYFCYQVAYGFIMPQNGSVTVTNPNGMWATFMAPPGTVVSNFTIRAEGPPVNLTTNTPVAPPVILANDTWTIVNSTSGSVGTIKFHQVWHNVDSETVVIHRHIRHIT